MTTYITITDPETDPEAPLTSELAKKWRDNAISMAEGDTTAPVNRACWHPYDMVFANDGALGRFYNGTAVASITTPTMVAGYDYMFRGKGISHSSGAASILRVNGVNGIPTNQTAADLLNFWFCLQSPVATDFPKFQSDGAYNVGGLQATWPAATVLFNNNATALTSFAFAWDTGASFDAGELFMYRRRNYMPN